MAFVDILTSQLFVLGFMGLILVYVTVDSYLSYRKDKKGSDFKISAYSGFVVLAFLGAYALITGLYGQLTWPLPGSYNILFYDVYTMIGLLMIAAYFSIKAGVKLQYVGFLAFLLGLMVILYGLSGYAQGLTQEPIVLLLLYIAYGGAGMLSWPVTAIVDRAIKGTKNTWPGWKYIIALFAFALFCGSMLALVTASIAVPAHLASPP